MHLLFVENSQGMHFYIFNMKMYFVMLFIVHTVPNLPQLSTLFSYVYTFMVCTCVTAL